MQTLKPVMGSPSDDVKMVQKKRSIIRDEERQCIKRK